MALVVQTLIVGGIILFAWGMLRTAWENRRDAAIGKLLVGASIVNLSVAILGLATMLH
jgi:hypothetical protein